MPCNLPHIIMPKYCYVGPSLTDYQYICIILVYMFKILKIAIHTSTTTI